MRFTLAEVWVLNSTLSKLFNKDLNIKIAYRLSKLLKKFNDEMKIVEEQRSELVKKYGKENAETKQIEVSAENQQSFMQEFNTLMQEEIEVDFEPIELSKLGDLSISAMDIAKMDGKIIKDDTKEEQKDSNIPTSPAK